MRNFVVRLLLVLLCLAPAAASAQYGYGSRPLTSKLNITSSSVLKTTNGVLVTFNVTTAGSAGAIYDSATSGTAANLIAVIPATVGTYTMQFPFFIGLLVVPGASQVVSVSYQ